MDVWAYLAVFLTAAAPLLEVLVVIPGATATGLHPVPVGILAFLGNLSTLVVVVLAADRVGAWLARRRGTDAPVSKRRQRLQRIAHRWGLPGVAVLAPLTTGTHVAALGALALRLPRAAVLAWMVAGLAGWSAVLVALSAAGREVL